ncbi:MAG: hypothetical protein F6J93_23720 [Oscillatoria sp. SIO1A7]|nr:hypothetical protein [Oscillatoria sp. SIO1A7]
MQCNAVTSSIPRIQSRTHVSDSAALDAPVGWRTVPGVASANCDRDPIDSELR